ncbi:MAG: cell division protein FtsZ [Akkermansiaceae bacterium]
MINFDRNRQQTIPESSVKIIGLGGAGANMLDRIALDGIEGAELLAMNTDVRTLASSVAGEKIQLGRNLTKGLGTGGDPELGENSIMEAEQEVRDALKGRQIVFICVGLGGGTGSGAAPIVTRLARESGAFVVVFATMPFGFEGQRRRTQAEEALNQLAVLTNALVTFDNGRMGELVLPKQGVHEAFSAADRMISDSITAVSRLVLRPGLINVGLDELMTALKTTRSRCLFGSGLARGESRATGALKAALASPLLDRGSLLKDATTVLVHICGGEDMTLFEIDLLMEGLMKHVPAEAHVLFGAATDVAMKDAMSVTIISALPEDRLQMSPIETTAAAIAAPEPEALNDEAEEIEEVIEDEQEPLSEIEIEEVDEIEATNAMEHSMELQENETALEIISDDALEVDTGLEGDLEDLEDLEDLPERSSVAPALRVIENDEAEVEEEEVFEATEEILKTPKPPEDEPFRDLPSSTGQGELELEGGPKGRFDGETPNIENGEDLDIPPYLRKKRRR